MESIIIIVSIEQTDKSYKECDIWKIREYHNYGLPVAYGTANRWDQKHVVYGNAMFCHSVHEIGQ